MSLDYYQFALVQMRVGPDKDDNLDRAGRLLAEAAEKDIRLAVLPEMFNCPYEVERFAQFAEPIPDGRTCRFLSETAAELGLYLVGGSIPEQDGYEIYNTATLWSPKGELLLKHRKVHLFDVDIPGGITFQESGYLSPGDKIEVIETELGVLGLGVCYDLRFPELFRSLALAGAELVLLPGAFNTTTGPSHWEILIRARAIENTFFLAACASAPHPEVDYPTWGNSMAVDPYGWVLDSAGRHQEIVYAAFDRQRLKQVRRGLPVLFQRRPEVYRWDWEE